MVEKTDPNYGKGEAVIDESKDTLDPVLKQIRESVKNAVTKEDFEMPMLPHIATQVLQMAQNPRASFPDLEKLVKQDQGIAAKVIKTANSPFYRGLSQIVSLRDAMSRIGLRALKDIVFSLSVHSKVFRIKGFEKIMDQTWEHSVACAALSQLIAKKASADAEFGFLAGLLHDIGKPVLVQVIANLQEAERKKKAKEMRAAGKSFDQKKFDIPSLKEILIPLVFNEYHSIVGALVAAKWKLPNALVEVIRYHHDYAKAEEAQKMTTIVHLANLLCHHFGFGHDEAPVILEHQQAFQMLNLNEAHITQIADQAPDAVAGLSGLV